MEWALKSTPPTTALNDCPTQGMRIEVNIHFARHPISKEAESLASCTGGPQNALNVRQMNPVIGGSDPL